MNYVIKIYMKNMDDHNMANEKIIVKNISIIKTKLMQFRYKGKP